MKLNIQIRWNDTTKISENIVEIVRQPSDGNDQVNLLEYMISSL